MPVPLFDLFTFELKMPPGCNMLAVHEALAHAAFGHFPYLCLYPSENEHRPAELPSMMEQCKVHGVGVITIPFPLDLDSYELSLLAPQHFRRSTNCCPGGMLSRSKLGRSRENAEWIQ